MPIRGQNNVQGASDVGAIPFAYTDYRPVTDPANRAEYARAWGVPEESLSLKNGMMVTEMTQDGSAIRGLYIMGENPVISDPNIPTPKSGSAASSSWRCRTSSSRKPRAGLTSCSPARHSPRRAVPTSTPSGASSSPRPPCDPRVTRAAIWTSLWI